MTGISPPGPLRAGTTDGATSRVSSATRGGGRYRRRIGAAPGPAGDQGRYPVQHDPSARRQRLAVIDRNLDWVASCYGMR